MIDPKTINLNTGSRWNGDGSLTDASGDTFRIMHGATGALIVPDPANCSDRIYTDDALALITESGSNPYYTECLWLREEIARLRAEIAVVQSRPLGRIE